MYHCDKQNGKKADDKKIDTQIDQHMIHKKKKWYKLHCIKIEVEIYTVIQSV